MVWWGMGVFLDLLNDWRFIVWCSAAGSFEWANLWCERGSLLRDMCGTSEVRLTVWNNMKDKAHSLRRQKKVYLKMDYPHSSAIFWEKGGFKLRTTGFVWNLCTLESIGNTYYYPHYFKAMRYTMIYPNFRHIQLDLVAEDRHDQRPLAAHHAEVSGCIFLGSPIGEPW